MAPAQTSSTRDLTVEPFGILLAAGRLRPPSELTHIAEYFRHAKGDASGQVGLDTERYGAVDMMTSWDHEGRLDGIWPMSCRKRWVRSALDALRLRLPLV